MVLDEVLDLVSPSRMLDKKRQKNIFNAGASIGMAYPLTSPF